MKKKLIFVYNAQTGWFNQTSDWIHKVVSPETYACNLCALTHTNFGAKVEWQEFIDGLDAELEFLHKDEFEKKYTINTFSYPFIGEVRHQEVTEIINSEVIDTMTELTDLKQVIAQKLQTNLVLVFTRNPELGKVKTRLAKGIGEENALEIYKYLLQHTHDVVSQVKATKRVLYSETIVTDDIWSNSTFDKVLQSGGDLGFRMYSAFTEGFSQGYEKIVIVGSDLYDINPEVIEEAYQQLDQHDVVLGPAEDGGYYLLGLKFIPEKIFNDKDWGTETVLQDTLHTIEGLDYKLLSVKNDIDTIEDIKGIPVFEKYLKV